MPLFEYACTGCNHQFEALVRNGQKVACPACESTKVEKLLSAAATRMGGSQGLPIAPSACPPSDAPPCGPGCCRM